MDQTLITRIVEAALLASPQPLTLSQLHGLFPEEQPAPPGSVERAIELLREGSSERGVELVEVASGFRFQVQNDVHEWVARLWTERRTKYTRATLETLALIAYRQPITRGEIEQVRGVTVSSSTIQALEERDWIRVVGHRDMPGRPELLGTTKTFLDYFGLKRLDELPPLSELRDIGELEPQLPFESAPIAAGLNEGDGAAANDGEHSDANDPTDTLDATPDDAGEAPHETENEATEPVAAFEDTPDGEADDDFADDLTTDDDAALADDREDDDAVSDNTDISNENDDDDAAKVSSEQQP